MDRMAMIVGNDGNKFKEYLDVQSRFSKYSVGNSLVILEKAPNSTHIKDKNAWLEKGIELNNSAKGIKILEPVKNKGATYYNPKVVYDISQTNAPKQDNVINYGDRVLLKALLHNCDVPREAVEKLPSGEIGAEYDKENNKLYVCKGMDRETLFQSLSQEMGNIELKDIEKEINAKELEQKEQEKQDIPIETVIKKESEKENKNKNKKQEKEKYKGKHFKEPKHLYNTPRKKKRKMKKERSK